MRMWMIDTKLMCGSHRSGEHNEIHKHRPHIESGGKIDGRFSPFVAIELQSLVARHDELAATLNHKSPFDSIPGLREKYPDHYGKTVDMGYNLKDLASRCDKCRALIEAEYPNILKKGE